MTRLMFVTAALVMLSVSACERAQEPVETTPQAGESPGPPRVRAADYIPARSACELVEAQDVAELVGEAVRAEREDIRSAQQSICAYSTRDGVSLLYITAYWSGGRNEWRERPLADAAHRAVAGIGDAAYYGGLLPSAILSGDVLLEFAMPLLPDEETSFRILAQKAVARL